MSPRTFVLPLLLLACATCTTAPALAGDETSATAEADPLFAPPPQLPKEAGSVHWRRDWNAAVEESKSTGKPLFVQFQEVPG